MEQKKVPWWKRAFAWLLDSEWDIDPYKVAAFILIWQFMSIVQTVQQMAVEKADVGLIGVVSALLLPITTMITFLFNFSKEADKHLTMANKKAMADTTPEVTG